MENPKTILVIHASDSEQHLGHFKKILDNLKEEERIASYTTLDSNSVVESSFKALGSEDMVVVMLTNNILDSKTSIENWLADVKNQSDIKVAEILIDNIPYETGFIAFPTSLEPIRASEDMDSVWQGIANNFEKLFPKPEIKPEPSPMPPPPPPKPAWKKYIPYILGIVALIIAAFFLLRECNKPKPGQPEIGKFTVEGVSAEAQKTNITSQNCPEELVFEGIIQTNGAGEIQYRWVGSDGSKSDPETLEVSRKGKHRVDFVWNFGQPGKTHKSQWQQIEILKPVNLKSGFAKFNLKCSANVAVLIVEDVFSITGRGTVATGTIRQGSIKVGDQVYINDQGNPIICTGIEKFRKLVDSASEGENVGLLLRGISKSDVKKGDKLVIR